MEIDMIERIIKKRAKRSKIWNMSKQELEQLVQNSERLGDILKAFGLENKGGNHHTLKRRLNEENIDYSHIKLGLDANKGRKFNIKLLDNEELFRQNSPHSRSTIKSHILKDNLIPYKCAICGFEGLWNDKELVLVLDHINGIHNDHRIENLRFLCPNCNSQQDTFAGKNNIQRSKTYCIDCEKEISHNSKRCQSCASIEMKKGISKRPYKEQLTQDITTMSIVQVGKKYGVSDNAVKKWCKFYDIWDLRKYKK